MAVFPTAKDFLKVSPIQDSRTSNLESAGSELSLQGSNPGSYGKRICSGEPEPQHTRRGLKAKLKTKISVLKLECNSVRMISCVLASRRQTFPQAAKTCTQKRKRNKKRFRSLKREKVATTSKCKAGFLEVECSNTLPRTKDLYSAGRLLFGRCSNAQPHESARLLFLVVSRLISTSKSTQKVANFQDFFPPFVANVRKKKIHWKRGGQLRGGEPTRAATDAS